MDTNPSETRTVLQRLLIASVAVDLIAVVAILLQHPTKGAATFRTGEVAIKLLGLKGVLGNRWWGYAIVAPLAVLAVLTTARLPFQKNNRAARSPLTWISACAQLAGGVAAGALLAQSRRSR